ncbi:MAG: hypothetical protein AAF591_18205 [Verrucomicrobiota bacterium]
MIFIHNRSVTLSLCTYISAACLLQVTGLADSSNIDAQIAEQEAAVAAQDAKAQAEKDELARLKKIKAEQDKIAQAKKNIAALGGSTSDENDDDEETTGDLGTLDLPHLFNPVKYPAAKHDKDDRLLPQQIRLENLFIWDLDWQFGKLGTRAYFDVGTRDPGEIQLFDEGSLQANIDFLSIYAHRPFFGTGLDWGPSTSIGIGSSNGGNIGDAAIVVWSYGVFFRPVDARWQLEFGGMTGWSSDPDLDSTTRDDSAIFVGLSFGSLIDSAKDKIVSKK